MLGETMSSPLRGRLTLRIAVLFLAIEIVAAILFSVLRTTAEWEFFRKVASEWPVWLLIAQLIDMPLILWRFGWPSGRGRQFAFVAANVAMIGIVVLGVLQLFEVTLFRSLELLLRLCIIGVWTFAVLGIVPVARGIAKRRRLRDRRPFLAARLWFACLLGLLLSEPLCGWLLWREMTLTFPRNLPPSPRGELHVVAIGGSTMVGHPYEPKYGIAEVAVWRLRQMYPQRNVVLHNLAISGQNLRQAIQCLRQLDSKPDLLLVYSGHNEFYQDMDESSRMGESPFRVVDPLLMLSPTFVMAYRPLSQRSALRGMRNGTSTLVANHILPSAACRRRLVRFREYLVQLAGFCQREQIPTLWYVPAANEADWEPNRSVPAAFLFQATEYELEKLYEEARKHEADEELDAAIAMYRRGLQSQPDFAEFHYRLGRCLFQLNRDSEAAEHFQRALDADGHPIRANANYRTLVAEVATQYEISLVDAPAMLRAQTERGHLDRTLFHDNVHPTLKTFFLLGTAACEIVIKEQSFRDRLGEPVDSISPDFAQSVEDAGITAEDLSLACRRIAHGTRWMTRWRFDDTGRDRLADQLERWSKQLASGEIQPGDDGSEPLP